MYSYIIGRVTEFNDLSVTLENNQIGYEVFVSSFSMEELKTYDGEVKMYIYYQQKEDGVSLFGFLSSDEKELFLKLISVSGVGPKVAIAILSKVSFKDLCTIISSQDVSALSKIKGIGKKTAERLVIELKDKVVGAGELSKTLVKDLSKEVEEASDVLFNLGIPRNEAVNIAKDVYEKGDSTEDVVTKALRSMRQ